MNKIPTFLREGRREIPVLSTRAKKLQCDEFAFVVIQKQTKVSYRAFVVVIAVNYG